MKSRALLVGAFIWVACTLVLRAGNPDDIDFVLRLTKGPAVYHIGEAMEFELSYSSPTSKKYRGSWTTPSPDLDVATLHLNPTEGAVDLRRLHDGGVATDILSGIGYLGQEPVTQKADLAEWYRFEKPGHYALSVTSLQVSRVKSADQAGGQEPVPLESNAAEFDILPADSAWESQELVSILQALDSATGPADRTGAYRRLALLDTPASVRKLVQMYLSSSDMGDDSYAFYHALSQSSHLKMIIPLLEAGLTDPAANPPSNVADLLADLQVRDELGASPALPEDPAKQQVWQDKYTERSKVHAKYFALANEMVLASIRRRSGPQRTLAVFQAWYNAERQNGNQPAAPEMLAQLRLDVLASATGLQPAQQVQFLSTAWNIMPREPLLPVIRNLSHRDHAGPPGGQNYQMEAFRFWCEEWPGDCGAAMRADLLDPGSQIPPHIALLMPEAEHAELDKVLEQRLEQSDMRENSLAAQQTAILILRAGGRSLRYSVQELLDRRAGNRMYNCDVQGYLLGYLFRVGSDDAEKRLSAELHDRTDLCGSQLLHTLHAARFSDGLIPIAVNALSGPNIDAAGSAALLLGERGPASVEDALWRRLNVLWNQWRDRAAELSVASLENDAGRQVATLEQSLASALVNAKNWKLTAAEQDRLRAGCLTGQCQAIADGKMSMGL